MNTLLNDVVSLANATKLNKKKPFDAFMDIMNALNTGEKVYPQDLAVLYKKFMPSAPAKPKTAFDWVKKATAKKDARYYLRYVCSDGSNLVATDAHRIHVVFGHDLEEGFYDNGKNCDIGMKDTKYPNWKLLIPENLQFQSIPETNVVLDSFGGKPVELLRIGDIHIMKKYFNDAMSGMSNPEIAFANDRAFLREGNRMAVIMAFKVS